MGQSNMDKLKAMQVFVEVAKLEGFSAAARQLHISTTAVSRQVMELEDWLDVQLFNRTTRHLGLTDAGRAYLDRCIHIIDDVENLERTSRDLKKNPQGKINVTAPVFMGRLFLSAVLPKFLKKYPGIKLNLQLVDRYVNLVDEGFDVALRIGNLPDSNLITRKLGDMQMVMVASPKYIKKHGEPKSINELKNFNCIVDSVADYLDRWPLVDKKTTVNVKVKSNLNINNGELVREMALSGLGITLLPDFFVAKDIKTGRLVSILKDKIDKQGIISALYPQSRHLSSSVRVFVDFLVEHSKELCPDKNEQ
jgi:DNA-binding transcriptional LysR family regulator